MFPKRQFHNQLRKKNIKDTDLLLSSNNRYLKTSKNFMGQKFSSKNIFTDFKLKKKKKLEIFEENLNIIESLNKLKKV